MGSRIGAITFGGLSSGLPTDEIIGKLLELSRRPIQLLEKQRDDSSERLALYQELNLKTTALRNALRKLDNMADVVRRAGDLPLPAAFEEFRRYTAVTSDEDKTTASITGGATPGSLVLAIEQLARQHRSLSDPFAARDTVVAAGGGTLGIAIGSEPATDIAIQAGATVQNVVDAVNAAGLGASAFVVDDGQGSVRIAITGNQTGSEQALTLTNDFGLVFTTTQTAQNARIELDPDSALTADGGLVIESATNSFEDVIGGLSLEVKATTSASERVSVAVTPDPTAVGEALTALVDAYNEIAELIRAQNTIDPVTHRGGPLLGDSTLVSLAQRLATGLTRSYGDGEIQSLAQLGIEIQDGGGLELESGRLEAALESSMEEVARFMAGANGFADQMRQIADAFVDPKAGMLSMRITGTNEVISELGRSIEKAEERLDGFEANLIQQFRALEQTLAGLQQQGNFLTSFLLGQR